MAKNMEKLEHNRGSSMGRNLASSGAKDNYKTLDPKSSQQKLPPST